MAEKMKERVVSFETFDKLWANAKSEIFRLQLLNSYDVEEETDALAKYRRGEGVNALEDAGFRQWLSDIEKKAQQGVRIIDLKVIDLPMSDYLRFGISTYSVLAKEKGQIFMMVERGKVSELVTGFKDYWMFDSNAVLKMNYDTEGRFVNMVEIVDRSRSKYAALASNLLKVAMSMDEFLRINKVGLTSRINHHD